MYVCMDGPHLAKRGVSVSWARGEQMDESIVYGHATYN